MRIIEAVRAAAQSVTETTKQFDQTTTPRRIPNVGTGRRPETSLTASILKWNLMRAVSTAQRPPLSPQEAEKKADDLIAKHGGREHLDTQALGEELAALARQNPSEAWQVAQQIFGGEIDEDGKGKLREKDKDEVAQSLVDGLSEQELELLARDESGRALLSRMQGHLLSGSVHSDERESAERVQKALSQYSVFSDFYQGVEAGYSPGVTYDPDATPEEAAAAIKGQSESFGNENSADVRALAFQLEQHKNDPEWLREFFSALGTDETARLLSASVEQSTYVINGSAAGAADYMRDVTTTIMGALETMQKHGYLSQSDMNNLVNALPENPNIAVDLFARSSNDALKEMFVRAAIANGDDMLDAAASHVLASMPLSRQAAILGDLAAAGKLNDFIKGAMAGQTQILSLSDTLSHDMGPFEQVTFGGVEKLLANANRMTSFPHSPYRHPAYPAELQKALFNAAAQGLSDPRAFENFEGNKAFKDNLSLLFMKHRDDLLYEAQRNGSGANAGIFNPAFADGLKNFFQLALMTPPQGARAEELSLSLFKFFNDSAKAMTDPKLVGGDDAAYRDFTNAHRGMQAPTYATMVGSVLGCIVDATGRAQEAINKDVEQQRKVNDFLVGLAFSLIPGAGGALTKALGGGGLASFVGAAAGYLADKGLGALQGTITDALTGSGSDDAKEMNELADGLYYLMMSGLPDAASPTGDPNNPGLNLQDAFQRGFFDTSRYDRFDDATNGG